MTTVLRAKAVVEFEYVAALGIWLDCLYFRDEPLVLKPSCDLLGPPGCFSIDEASILSGFFKNLGFQGGHGVDDIC